LELGPPETDTIDKKKLGGVGEDKKLKKQL